MIPIPQQDAQTVFPSVPTDAPRVDASPILAGGRQVAQGMDAIGQGIGSMADVLAKHALIYQGMQNEASARDADTKGLIEIGKLQDAFLTLEGKNRVDAYPKYQADLQGLRQQLLASMPNQASRQMLDAVFTPRMGYSIISGSRAAADANKQYIAQTSVSRISATIDDATRNYNDPILFQRSLGVIKSEVDNQAGIMGWSPETTAAEAAKYTGQAWKLRVERTAEDSPQAALKMIEANKDQIDGETYVGLGSIIKQGLRQQAMEARQAAVEGRQAAMEVRANASLQVQDQVASINETGKPGPNAFTQHDIMSIYGPRQGPAVWQHIQRAENWWDARSQIAVASPDDEVTILGNAAVQPGPGAAEQAQVHADLTRAIVEKHKALTADPAGYVLGAYPNIAQALTDASQDPTKMPAYAAQLNQVYDHFGIPEAQRDLLPAAQAQALVHSVISAPAPTRAEALAGMAGTYGDLWPQVYASMVKAGMPGDYHVLPLLEKSSDRAALASMIGDGKTPAVKAIAEGDWKQINKDIEADPNLAQLSATMSQDPEAFLKIKEGVKTLAAGLRYQGADTSASVTRAVAAIAGKYDFGDTYRVPKGRLDDVADMAAGYLKAWRPDLAPLGAGGSVGLTPERVGEITLQNAANGYWRTNEHDNGLVLYGQNGNPVMLKNGKRAEFLWGAQPLPSPEPSITVPLPGQPGFSGRATGTP